MASPTPYDIELVRGDTWEDARFRWLDADGAPVALLDARLQIRRRESATTTELVLDVGSGLTINPSGWWIEPTITPAQTATLQKNGVYDVEATSLDDEVRTIASGAVQVIKDVTR